MRRTARNVVLDFAELSDPGLDPLKQVNEDSASFAETPLGHLAVVCDGMGGHVGGRVASETAVRTIVSAVAESRPNANPSSTLAAAIRAAGAAVHALGGQGDDPSRPGATCVAVLVNERGALIAHVGDSRALLVRGDTLQRLTRDHSLVEELVAAGVLAPELAATHPEANKITRALGIKPTVEVDVRPTFVGLQAGDVLLLVTDGVTDLVSDAELVGFVRSHLNLGAAVVCQTVIDLANSRGGHDNSTLLVLHLLEVPVSPSAGDTLLIDPRDREEEPKLPPAPFGAATADDTVHNTTHDTERPLAPGAPPTARPPHGAGPTVVDEWLGPFPAGHPSSARRGRESVTLPPRSPSPGALVARPLLMLGVALLVVIGAVTLLRQWRSQRMGRPPPALVVESSTPVTPQATALEVAIDPMEPAPTASAPAIPSGPDWRRGFPDDRPRRQREPGEYVPDGRE
ncbi:MAG: protein phosphatase 2C domain-containing protein [Polyangiaceae bacterium]|nr:protein phosphatase 2C domain-containing protein [Polyangiaceae bacterium]